MKIDNLTFRSALAGYYHCCSKLPPTVEEDKFEIQVRCMSTINTNLNKNQMRGGYN